MDYEGMNPCRFHMPGHKGGRGFSRETILHQTSWDITEVRGADNLLSPTGILAEAQKNVAKKMHASDTFFITTGSTTAILAILLSLNQETTMLMSRDCHKSVISGLALSGLDADFLDTPFDQEKDRYGVIRVQDVAEKIKDGSKPDALLVTSPDYWGRCLDLQGLRLLCDENDMLLIVDEAHGAHFSLADCFPIGAHAYADLWVQSAHKTLAAMNQCAYLHKSLYARSKTPSYERLAQSLRLIHTTSPAYPLLNMLEQACVVEPEYWVNHVQRLQNWRDHLPSVWKNATAGRLSDLGVQAIDPTRLVIDCHQLGISGIELDAFLWKKNIVVEMSDWQSVVLITSPFDEDNWYERLAEALKQAEIEIKKNILMVSNKNKNIDRIRRMSIREATLSNVEAVDPVKAVGRVCAQSAGLYPPGYAVLLPGEVIDLETVVMFEEWVVQGQGCFGWPPMCVIEE